jgi:glycosyltransferase involved in cell wall biosynthesis
VETLVLAGEPRVRTAVLGVAGVRASGSVGIARYAARLADALAAHGIDYRPSSSPPPGAAAHFHLANSSRAFVWRARSLRRPHVVTVHDVLPRTRALLPLYRHVAYPALRGAAAVVVHSAFAAALLEREAGAAPVRVIPHFAPPGLDADRTAAQSALGWTGDAPLFLLPGVLKRVKLVDETLQAAAPLLETGAIRLAFAGPVPDAALARRARRLGAFVLVAPDTERYETAIAAADVVLVLRSDSVGETNGPLLDALGAGRAVLATSVGSIPEVAGEAARYTPATADGIRAGLLALCDGAERESREAVARERGRELHPDRVAAAHAELFREVFDG